VFVVPSNGGLPSTCVDVQYGVCSRDFIPRGSFVCEVVGQYRRTTDADADVLADNNLTSLRKWCSDETSNVILFLDDIFIDSRKFGNVSKFIRRHCSSSTAPVQNLDRKFVFVDNVNNRFPRLALYAARDIYSGEELVM